MSKLRESLVKFLDEIGERSGCHRMPERSFFYKGHQFPVCARCTGVCIGQLTAILVGLCCNVPALLSLLMLGIMGADWGVQEIGLKESTNRRRLLTGMLGGFGLFSLYIHIFKYIKDQICKK